jgi:hypothetical protein
MQALIEEQGALEPEAYTSSVDLSTLVSWFEDSEENTQTERQQAERDRDYYDNKQLSAAELAELKRRGQPDIIINRIQTKVNYLLGYEASQRQDPRGYPRTPQDEDSSEAATDALRYVSQKQQLDQVFSTAWSNMLIEGFGGAELAAVPKGEGDAEIKANQVHWDRTFYDKHSRDPDFSDARYLGTVIWMDEQDALTRWNTPEQRKLIEVSMSESDTNSMTYEDRPHWKQWVTGIQRKRVRIVQIWFREGLPGLPNYKWSWCIFTKGGKLEQGQSPYTDEDGESLCPMILQSAFVDRENNRYGLVRALIGPQDEINKRRSKALHLLNVRQTIGEDGAVDDVDEMKDELAKPDGHVVTNPGLNFEVVQNSDQLSGQLQLLQEAKNEIDLLGPNAAMQGKGERSASGRAIIANQQGGQIEIATLVDRHKHFKERVYRLIWAMVRQYWTAQKWVRVTDDDKNTKFVGLNRPVTLAEDLIAQAVSAGMEEAEVKQRLKQEVQAKPELRFQLEQIVRVENVPAEMDMDIILEEVPDSANIQQEQFEILARLAQAGVQFPPKVYIEASALRDKRKLLETLEAAQQDAQQDESAQALGRAQLEKLAGEIADLKAAIAKKHAETAHIEAQTSKTLMEADVVDGQLGLVQEPSVFPAGQPQDVGFDGLQDFPTDVVSQPTPDQIVPVDVDPLQGLADRQPQFQTPFGADEFAGQVPVAPDQQF